MIATAQTRFARSSARKVRDVLPLVRGKRADLALAILQHTPRRAAGLVADTLRSAVANAKHRSPDLTEQQLVVSRLVANDGPVLKRFRAATMGRASHIRRRMCHIAVELELMAAPPGHTPAVQRTSQHEPRRERRPRSTRRRAMAGAA